MAEQEQIPLPPLPSIVHVPAVHVPWMQLGELDVTASQTPPPQPFPEESRPAERAAMRFAVNGNAICMYGSFFKIILPLLRVDDSLAGLFVDGAVGVI
jgi:hypothetical protein